MHPSKRAKQSDAGWALASVLWAVAALSLMAAASQDLALLSHRAEHHAFEQARAEAVLSAAMTAAVLGISASTNRWRVDGAVRELALDGEKLKVRVQDEAGRYDLNAIDAGALTVLLESAGVEADRAAALSNSILDWRSPSGPHRLNAATDDDYAAAGLAYRPRHSAFQSVDELQLVLGMSKDVFRAIRPPLTVYSKRPGIDPTLAPIEALLVLYNGNRELAEAALKARGGGDDSALPIYPSSHQGVLNTSLSLAGRVYDIRAETRIGERWYRRERVILLTGNPQTPFIPLWSE